MVGGVLFGVVFGALGAAVLRAAPDHLTAVLVTIVVVFGTSLLSETVHASPVIAVVVVGLVLGRTARHALPSSRVLALKGFWETIGFGLNVLVFLLVGMQIDAPSLVVEAPAILLAVGAMHIGRALAVYGSFLGSAHAQARAYAACLAARDGGRQHQRRAVDGCRARASSGRCLTDRV